ncbi:MAG: hypothetical protein QG572_1614, partial [Pseudomonadota bacterium]|nr:hypothetical protein [Pseudomonadota bacterium]
MVVLMATIIASSDRRLFVRMVFFNAMLDLGG